MSTSIDHTQTYTAEPAEVQRMLLDPDFAVAKCLASGSIEATSELVTEDGQTTLIIRRVLPAKLPSFAKALVGETLNLIETQQWHEPRGDARTASFLVDFGNNPISFHGDIAVGPHTEGTHVRTKGTIKCTVPLMGGRIESVAAEWIGKYLAKEQQVGTARLAGE